MASHSAVSWCLYSLCVVTALPIGETSYAYEIPPFHEVINNAMYIYGTPIRTDLPNSLLPVDQLVLFPFMNFTCNGTIQKLIFLSKPRCTMSAGPIETNPVSSLSFSLWHRHPTVTDQYTVKRSTFINFTDNSTQDIRHIEVTFNKPDALFEEGDVIGVHSSDLNDGSLLYQVGGSSGLLQVCSWDQSRQYGVNCLSPDWPDPRVRPYIAVQTGDLK